MERVSTTEARNVTQIESATRSDFCPSKAIYFTLQKEVAKYYAKLHRRTSGLGNGILTIYIRQFEHKTVEGDTWKKFVFLNRRGNPLPKEFNQWKMAPVLKGQVAGGTNESYHRKRNWQQVKKLNVRNIQPPLQYHFLSRAYGLLANVEAHYDKLD